MATMIQNNFIAGEISPALYGRSDLAAYYHACAKAENFVVTREGTLKKRRGIATGENFGKPYTDFRVFPYVYDRTNGGFVVFWLDGVRIRARLYSKADLANPGASVTVQAESSSVDDIGNIRCTQIGDTIFVTLKGSFNRKLVVTWATLGLAVSDYSQNPVPSAVTKIEAEATGLGTSGRTITYGAYVCKDGVLSGVKTASVTVSKTWTAGGYVTITVRHGLDLGEKDFDYVLIGKKSGSYFGELARFYPDDVTASTVEFQDENHTPADVIYSQTNVLGADFRAPQVVNAFQQRLVFANASSNGSALPMTMWFSAVGDLYNYYANRPTDDSDPFSPTLMSTGPSFIRWLVAYQKLMIVFTDAGIFAVSGSANEGFSASTCQINKLSNLSVSQTIQPVETEAGIVFVGADNKTLYTLAYDLQTDSNRPINRMMLVKHLTRNRQFTSIALQQYPDQVIWCCLSDGTLASFTFDRREDENICAWSHHSSNGMTFRYVLSTGTVTDSSTDCTYSDIIFFIDRVAGASSYFAQFSSDFNDTFGTTVTPVVAELVTLPSESTQETVAFRTKNVKDVLVKLFESGPVQVMPYGSGLAEQTLNSGQTSFSGEAKAKPMGYVNDLGQMRFRSTGNANAEILAVVTKMEVG